MTVRRLPTILAAVLVATTLLPTLGNAASVTEGRRSWLKLNCSGCHGDQAGGGMGPNVQRAETGDVQQAMNGDAREGGMRSFKGIYQAPDPANIAAYLRVAGTPQSPTWVDWWNTIP